MKVITFFPLFSWIIFTPTTAIQCMNENNDTVDWFYMYKIPKIKHNNSFINTGVGYTYLTSKNYSKWQFSKFSINDTNSMVGNTLSPYYQNLVKNRILMCDLGRRRRDISNTAFVFYNDQPPDEPKNSNKGHTKGVIISDIKGGFWLIHSVPHFPQLGPKYKFSPSGFLKGQSFLCISLNLENINKVGLQLQYNQPQIFTSFIPEILKTKINKVVEVISGHTITEPPWYNLVDLISLNGVYFKSFAKAGKFKKDLYEDWVAPTLLSNLYVETWPNGHGRLPSNCSKPFKVYNIQNVTVNATNITFSDTQDHSKWAVGQNLTWICVGDINRMEHQKQRGGGTVCLNNPKIANNYRDSIKAIEKCHINQLN